MDCEWKSIRFYGFSMDSNDQTGSRPLRLRLRGLQHSPGSTGGVTWAARRGGPGGDLAIDSLDWS